jgi:hypothetical protein
VFSGRFPSGLQLIKEILMKKLLLLGAISMFVAIAGIPALADMPSLPPLPPDGPIKLELTERPVFYDHSVHTSQRCETCHTVVSRHFPPMATAVPQTCEVCHHQVDGAPPPTVYCSECHTELLRTNKTVNSYFRIIHGRSFTVEGRVSCLSCHMEVIKTRPEKRQELTACSGSSCHPKT